MIYDAASSAGAYAVKLAKRAGLCVIGIADLPCDFVITLGADVVLDYRKFQAAEYLVRFLAHCVAKR